MHRISLLLSRIPSILHAFGSASEPIPEVFPSQLKAHLPVWNQVHGIHTSYISTKDQELGDTDAMWTDQPGILVGIRHADCVPILLARKDGTAVGAIHAGWKGTLRRIARSFCDDLRGAGQDPRHWVAAIGPRIGACCFEVGEEVRREFLSEFPEIKPHELEPAANHLDLGLINQRELLAAGLTEIELLQDQVCTRCTMTAGTPAYHSFRREKNSSRQHSCIAIRLDH